MLEIPSRRNVFESDCFDSACRRIGCHGISQDSRIRIGVMLVTHRRPPGKISFSFLILFLGLISRRPTACCFVITDPSTGHVKVEPSSSPRSGPCSLQLYLVPWPSIARYPSAEIKLDRELSSRALRCRNDRIPSLMTSRQCSVHSSCFSSVTTTDSEHPACTRSMHKIATGLKAMLCSSPSRCS